ncbi:dipeptidase PepV [Thermotoga profunda]|uniref:dipeptidase PepV n=1 Tax=Thermotoga profunda TaxID=1508420 RepID=UPI0005973AA0|nr:dipeptidase PepV [Thermotoga profunda]
MNKKIDDIVFANSQQMFQEISNLIKIKSVKSEPAGVDKPFGEGIAKALEYALDLGKRLGFQVKNVDGYGGHIEYGRGGKLFAVLGHLDVVPEGDGWSVDPYSGLIRDGYLWGRGASDDKGPTIAAIFALKAVKDAGYDVKNRVRIILGTDEESGWDGIRYYFQKEEAPVYAVTPDANFPIIYAEKGIINYKISSSLKKSKKSGVDIVHLKAGEASNVVPQRAVVIMKSFKDQILKDLEEFKPKNGAKISWQVNGDELKIEVKGKSAHGSKPEHGINAAAALFDFLRTMEINDEGIETFIRTIFTRIGYETDGNSLRISGTDCIAGPLTLNLGTVDLDNDKITAVINIRYPIYYSEPMLSKQVIEALKPLQVEPRNHHAPLFVSPDSELIKMLSEVYTDVTGEKAQLLTTGGGTYARAVPCGVAFGPLLPGRPETEHQPDERIALDDLVLMTRIYAQLLYKVLVEW